jgi:hypothetical protein
MNCKFDPSRCSVECKKYSICSFYAMQNQFSEIQSQLNFIYETISKILKSNETADSKIKTLELAVSRIIKDSYTIKEINENKESNNEEEN